jgi:sec-independent protein translocase protein TatA
MPNIGPLELIIILVIALLILGPGKLPEVGAAFGKTIREFRKASQDIQESTTLAPKPATPTPNTLSGAATPNTVSEPAPRGAPADPADDQA